MPSRRRPATQEETRALAHPLRLRIIRLLYDGALTNKELADRLGQQPATVLHHVRTLARTGFIVADRPRPGPRGTTEKPYRSTGKSWQVSVEVPGRREQVARAAVGAFLAELDAVGPRADLATTRVACDISPARLDQLQERLSGLMDELAAEPPDPSGERWSVFIALNRRP